MKEIKHVQRFDKGVNIPYVKQYNEDGTISNPIIGTYTSIHPNRRERRTIKNMPPFYGCSKNFHLTTDGRHVYKRVRQVEFDKDGNKKILYHYISH